MNNFNIFHALSKDDKELIHSAVLKVLFEEEDFDFFSFLGIPAFDYHEIELEKGFTYNPNQSQKAQRGRFDLLIKGKQDVLILENKFKDFPRWNQLVLYSDFLDWHIHYNLPYKHKVLICFENLGSFRIPDGWIVRTYSDVKKAVQTFLESRDQAYPADKRVFFEHYVELLNGFLKDFESIQQDPAKLYAVFQNPGAANNKFWLSLMLSKLSSLLEIVDCFSYTFLVGGNTQVPLLNMHVNNWILRDADGLNEFVIQFQGGVVKFYAHLDADMVNKNKVAHKKLLEKWSGILKAKGFLEEPQLGRTFGKPTDRNMRTMAIYKEDILHAIPPEDFTLVNIKEYLLDFYSRINIVFSNADIRLNNDNCGSKE